MSRLSATRVSSTLVSHIVIDCVSRPAAPRWRGTAFKALCSVSRAGDPARERVDPEWAWKHREPTRDPPCAYKPRMWSPPHRTPVLRVHVASPEKAGEDLQRSLPVGALDPCQAARPPSYHSVCPLGSPPPKHQGQPPPDTRGSLRSASHGMPRARRRLTPPVGNGLLAMRIRSLATGERRGTSSGRCSHRVLQVTPPRTRHVLGGDSSPHREELVHADPPPALQTREDPRAHARPNREASRRLMPGHSDAAPRGTTLAAYPSRRRVRAMTAVRGRTRTGRMWFRGTAPFET